MGSCGGRRVGQAGGDRAAEADGDLADARLRGKWREYDAVTACFTVAAATWRGHSQNLQQRCPYLFARPPENPTKVPSCVWSRISGPSSRAHALASADPVSCKSTFRSPN